MKPTVCLFILLWFINHSLLMGQNDACTEAQAKYKEADRAYTEGNIVLAKEMLEKISKANLSQCPDTEVNVSFLLSKLYLLTNEDTLATEYYKKVLRNNPSFKINDALEPLDMVYFAKQYSAIPWFSFVPSVSLIKTNIRYGAQRNSVEAILLQDTTIETLFTSIPSIGSNLSANFYPSRHWEIAASLGVDKKNYDMRRIYYRTGSPNSTAELVLIEEQQRWLNTAATVKYNFKAGIFNLILFTGVDFNYLENAQFTLARRGGLDLIENLSIYNNTNPGEKDYFIAKKERIDLKTIRNQKVILGYFAGAGIKIMPPNAQRNFFILDMKLGMHNNSFTPTDNIYIDDPTHLKSDLMYGLGYLEDNLKIAYTQFSLGYSYTFYRVVERKKNFLNTF
jgi:hypothetical protein